MGNDGRPTPDRDVQPHHERSHPENDARQEVDVSGRLNWLRAGVLGANDGIVATAAIVLGVAAATTSRTAILTAGIAALTAGAMSMAAGEYASVSSQRDSEKAMLAKQRRELSQTPEEELAKLTNLYADKGLSRALAETVARELTDHDALGAHAEADLGVDPDGLTSAWTSAFASLIAFAVGALVPLVGIAFPPTAWRIGVTVVASLLALAATGILAARLGRSPTAKPLWRNLISGTLAMAVTYSIGSLVGHVL